MVKHPILDLLTNEGYFLLAIIPQTEEMTHMSELKMYEVTMQVKKCIYAKTPEEAENKFWDYYQELNDDEYKIDVKECEE